MQKCWLYTILTILFLGIGQCFAQSENSIIRDIKIKYQHIQDNLKSYDTTKKDIGGESTEGGHGTAYYDGKSIRLIEIVWYGEIGKRQTEYYFDKGKLFFALDSEYEYNRSIYWDDKKAREFNDSVTFDPGKVIVKEKRYYFHKDKLINGFDNDKKVIDISTNSNAGQKLISHAYKMKDKLKK